MDIPRILGSGTAVTALVFLMVVASAHGQSAGGETVRNANGDSQTSSGKAAPMRIAAPAGLVPPVGVAAPIGIAVNGVCEAGSCPATTSLPYNTTPINPVTVPVGMHSRLFNKELFSISGQAYEDSSGSLFPPAYSTITVQYLGGSQQGSSLEDNTITVDVYNNVIGVVCLKGQCNGGLAPNSLSSEAICGVFSTESGIAIASGSSASVTVKGYTGSTLAMFGPFFASPAEPPGFSQLMNYSVFGSGNPSGSEGQFMELIVDKTYTSIFRAGSPPGSYIMYNVLYHPLDPTSCGGVSGSQNAEKPVRK